VVSLGRTTAMDYLVQDHHLDKATGELLSTKPVEPNQPTIEVYLEARSLDINRNFESFKALLIRWIVCCHIAFFQFENAYF